MIEQRKFSEVVKALVNARLVDVHTAMPARVVSYDRATRRASVQPLVREPQRREAGTKLEAMPILTSVPVMFQATSRNGTTFPLLAGDLVWVMFSEQALDRVLISDGNVTDPKSPVRFTMRGAVCMPGFHTSQTVDAESDNNAMVIHGDEIRLGSKTATAKVALVPGVEAAIKGVLSDVSVATAIVAAASGAPGTAAALIAAVNAYFAAHPVQGAQKVEAE